MGRFRVSTMRKFLQGARVSVSGLGKASRPGPAQCHALFRLERSVHVLFDANQLVFLEPSSSQKLTTSRSILIRHTHEVATQKLHISTYSSCCGIEPNPHHEDFEDFTFDLEGFDHNEEVVSHASRQAVTISNTALKKLLIGGESDHHRDDPSSHEGTTHDSEPLCDPSGSLLANDKASSCDPDPSWSRETTHASTPSSHKDDLMSFLKDCFEPIPSPEAALFINDAFFPLAALAFQSFFLQNCSQELRKQLQDLEPSNVREKVLFPMFVEFCTRQFPGEMIRFQALIRTADMTKPHALFPPARAIKRKIIYHHGPTNSGKTYNALQRFLQEPNGIYCSPLRLLAMEVYDYANGKGVLCSLITGQEKKEVPFSNHVSCTVEMSSMQQVWKVAVIDEVQLLNDDNRGWAWTRALLGLQAEEIHLCGDPSALSVVRSMCSATGDELEEYAYERFKPLAVDTDTLGGDFGNVQPGDCIVAFSRREIFEIKRAVERATHKRCCVVYGALPPETRAQQAKLFNEPDNGYDILVASDAVGMGLNLNIRRVVFHTLEKFDGELRNRIPVSLTKQIAGRAGRRGSLYPEGLVTTFHVSDLPHLLTCLEEPFAEACSAGLFPSCEQLQLFAEHMPDAKFSQLLERFVETSRVDAFYFLCQNRGLRKVASVIDTVDNLTLEERFTFCFSPVNARSQKSMGALLQYASSYSQKLPLQLLVGKPSWSPAIDFQLMDLEEKYQLLSLYLWLSQHFPAEFFPQKQEAVSMSMAIARTLGQSLTDLHN